jgi:two-component system OmpR family response regulator
MEQSPEILVVDDDREIRALLCGYLEKNGFRAVGVADGRALDRQMQRSWPDLVVLDLMLPGEDGFAICRRLRERAPQLPILILTARDEDVDQVLGFELGADDYVRKPFGPRALLARIRAILRRSDAGAAPQPAAAARAYRFGPWRLDTIARTLTNADGAKTSLNGAEYGLLVLLLGSRGRVLSRVELANALQGRDGEPFDRSIDVRVSRLRQKLGDDARSPTIVKTVYGAGYVIGVAVEAE